MWAQFAGAACHVVGGGCGGAVGGFEGGLGFDDTAGGVFESVCVTVIVILRYPAHVVGLSHPVLDSTSPFFDSMPGLLFNLWYPLIDLLFGLVPRCGHFVRRFVSSWHGGGFSGYGVCDGRRDLMG